MKNSEGGKAAKVDMMSNLPDPILHLILSRLPTTEEVIRTSILSTRYKHLWTLVPSIDIDCFRGLKPRKEYKRNKFIEFVNRILANKSINLDSFRLCCWFHYDMSTVVQWIDAVVRRNVKLIDLRFCLINEYDDIELPHCLVTCCSLEVLRLCLMRYRLSLPNFTGLPALKVLELKSCKLFNSNSVKDFLTSCPLLEDLILVDCETFDLDLFCISCPKLKNLRIDNRRILYYSAWDYGVDGMCKRLEICCPKLVYLEFAGFMAWEFIFQSLDSLKKVVIHPLDTYEWADNNISELFAGFFHVESLSLRMCLIQKFNLNLEDLPETLPNLKTLELTTTTAAYSMAVLMQILIRSPNLESLHLIIQKGQNSTEDDDLESWEMEYECIFERLKMVNMKGMSAVPHHLRFIEFLLESTPVLETMSITPCVNMSDYGRLSLSTSLPRLPRASTEAHIIFV